MARGGKADRSNAIVRYALSGRPASGGHAGFEGFTFELTRRETSNLNDPGQRNQIINELGLNKEGES